MIARADALRIPLANSSMHCCVTSPPYWGLRDYGISGQLGLEATPEAYVARIVDVFREVKRVLRDDGTLWLNIGDSYAGYHGNGRTGEGPAPSDKPGYRENMRATTVGVSSLKQKDLVGVPWMLAFALRADGWYLRSEIIWAKGSPMPESVRDRPTKAHEQVFLLTKQPHYFYDADAIRQPHAPKSLTHRGNGVCGKKGQQDALGKVASGNWAGTPRVVDPAGANARSVWTINSQSFSGAHFATMPLKLAAKCVKAGTSEKGCCFVCGAPIARIVERKRVATRPGNNSKVHGVVSVHADSPYHDHAGTICGNRDPKRHCTVTTTVGWEPSCSCYTGEPARCRVFDPFGGAGTTIVAAEALGRQGIMTELSARYIAIAKRRIERPHAVNREPKNREESMPLFRNEETE